MISIFQPFQDSGLAEAGQAELGGAALSKHPGPCRDNPDKSAKGPLTTDWTGEYRVF
ncbi:hypothetical protein TRIP_B50543 [uncultured Desulfatiglans sp.]|uniref:Uncharacterized protein n=1 Tax=Uncultured Desulfatiglans sp. TaxID=1748965 RepID=A0A653AI90_UNCDX|nr:hypothetical protein TRIP_B50543 [uncultured Desulfatiglans sp.]